MEHLRLEDLSDMAVLEAVDACMNGDDSCSTEDLVGHLDLNVKHPKRFIGIRLAWMRRNGLLDRDPDTGRWMWSSEGEALFESRRLTPTEASTLAKLGTRKEMGVATYLSSRLETDDPTTYNAVRRQIRHVELKRKAGYER